MFVRTSNKTMNNTPLSFFHEISKISKRVQIRITFHKSMGGAGKLNVEGQIISYFFMRMGVEILTGNQTVPSEAQKEAKTDVKISKENVT